MKTEQELKDLSADIGHAIMRYISAVAENLQELGHDVPVQGDDEYVDGIELMERAGIEIVYKDIEDLK